MHIMKSNTLTRFGTFVFSVGSFLLGAGQVLAAGGNDPTDPFGNIAEPPGVRELNQQVWLAGGGENYAGSIGIFLFISRLLQLFTVVAGLILFFNFIISGYTYLTSEGSPKAHEQVRNRITYSVIGIILIVCAYTITALLSLIFFGDATFILNPKLEGPITP
jgi:hypothetical protein